MIRMMGTILAVILLTSSASLAVENQGTPPAETPRFADYPVRQSERFKGKPAAVKLTSAQARRYRTMIREGALEAPNFAGHYTIVQWGCGAGCVQFAVVNAKTGAVFMPPFSVGPRALVEGQTGEPDEPLQFRVDSKLLIVSGSRNEKGEGIYYYKWDKDRLALVANAAGKKP
jgi:hypothetical protein